MVETKAEAMNMTLEAAVLATRKELVKAGDNFKTAPWTGATGSTTRSTR